MTTLPMHRCERMGAKFSNPDACPRYRASSPEFCHGCEGAVPAGEMEVRSPLPPDAPDPSRRTSMAAADLRDPHLGKPARTRATRRAMAPIQAPVTPTEGHEMSQNDRNPAEQDTQPAPDTGTEPIPTEATIREAGEMMFPPAYLAPPRREKGGGKVLITLKLDPTDPRDCALLDALKEQSRQERRKIPQQILMMLERAILAMAGAARYSHQPRP